MRTEKYDTFAVMQENMRNTKTTKSRRVITRIPEKSKHEQIRKPICKKGEKNK